MNGLPAACANETGDTKGYITHFFGVWNEVFDGGKLLSVPSAGKCHVLETQIGLSARGELLVHSVLAAVTHKRSQIDGKHAEQYTCSDLRSRPSHATS